VLFLNTFQGQALINGFNLGRYWPTLGPQVTLYVPGLYIKPYPETNILTILELDGGLSCPGKQVKGHKQFVRGYQKHTSCSVRLQKESILGNKCSELKRLEMEHVEYTGKEIQNRINGA
jgi:hypothetical protein